jgi:hypothetical protein
MRDYQQRHRQSFVAYRISYTQAGLMSYQVTAIEEQPRKRRRTTTTTTTTARPRPAKQSTTKDDDDGGDDGSEASSEADDPLEEQTARDQEAYDLFFGAGVAEDEPEPDPLPVLEAHGNQWLK